MNNRSTIDILMNRLSDKDGTLSTSDAVLIGILAEKLQVDVSELIDACLFTIALTYHYSVERSKMATIKAIRAAMDCGLVKAKDIVDAVVRNREERVVMKVCASCTDIKNFREAFEKEGINTDCLLISKSNK